MRTLPATLLGLMLAALACTGETPVPEATVRVTVSVVDTLVSVDDGLLQYPGDVVTTPDGKLLAVDYGNHEILEIDMATRTISRRYGGRGRGPGELMNPLGLFLLGDTIVTSNSANRRLERFHRDGRVLPSRRPADAAFTGRLMLDGFGGYVVPTNGADSSLVSVFDARDSIVARLGVPVVPPVLEWKIGEYRAAASRGEVADYYRNGTIVAPASDSSVWVAHLTQPLIERYSRDGRLILRVPLVDSVIPRILAQYQRRNTEDSTGIRVHPLYYVMDMRVDSKELWLALNSPPGQPAVILRLDSAARTLARIEIPGVFDVFRFALLPSSREIILSSAVNSEIYRVSVPEAAWR